MGLDNVPAPMFISLLFPVTDTQVSSRVEKMPVGAGRGLYRDGRPCKCIFKIVTVEQIKELVEIPRNAVIGRKLFHIFNPSLHADAETT